MVASEAVGEIGPTGQPRRALDVAAGLGSHMSSVEGTPRRFRRSCHPHAGSAAAQGRRLRNVTVEPCLRPACARVGSHTRCSPFGRLVFHGVLRATYGSVK
jgi:hypothetical protein